MGTREKVENGFLIETIYLFGGDRVSSMSVQIEIAADFDIPETSPLHLSVRLPHLEHSTCKVKVRNLDFHRQNSVTFVTYI